MAASLRDGRVPRLPHAPPRSHPLETKGRTLLLAVVVRDGRAATAKLLGITTSHLSNITSGTFLPSLGLAIRIEIELDIPPSAWWLGR